MAIRPVQAALAALALAAVCRAADIHLTLDSDVDLYLHDDKTWSCEPASARSDIAKSIMTLTLEDGTVVQLAPAGTWAYASKRAASADSTGEHVTMLFHVGVAQDSKADKAVERATQIAIKGLAKRMRSIVGSKVREEELCACIEGMQKNPEQTEKAMEGFYEVRVKITLDPEAIAGIKECCELSVRLDEKTRQNKKGK